MAELTPADILARSREVYATCCTYEDRGVVVTRSLQQGRAHTTRRPFSTAFARPDRFRFEWAEAGVGPEDEWDRMLVLWNEEGVRSSWTIEPGIRTHESVHAALACATGVSGGSAYTVPMLLLPGGRGRFPLPPPEEATLRGSERVEGRECFGLEHARYHGRRQVLWIDCAEFLLRRIDEEQIFDESVLTRMRQTMEESLRSAQSEEERRTIASAIEHYDRPPHRTFRTETVTSYEPILDAPILPERFHAPASWNPSAEATPEPPSRA